jgi:hypothetical protein
MKNSTKRIPHWNNGPDDKTSNRTGKPLERNSPKMFMGISGGGMEEQMPTNTWKRQRRQIPKS